MHDQGALPRSVPSNGQVRLAAGRGPLIAYAAVQQFDSCPACGHIGTVVPEGADCGCCLACDADHTAPPYWHLLDHLADRLDGRLRRTLGRLPRWLCAWVAWLPACLGYWLLERPLERHWPQAHHTVGGPQ